MPKKTVKASSFEQGGNNITRIDGERVFKVSKRLGFELLFADQVRHWNEYYKDTQYATACVTSRDELSLPFIRGHYPTDLERLFCLKQMLARGFIMGDCRDRRNFMTEGNKTYPIDFGQVVTPEYKFYNVYKSIFLAEIDRLSNLVYCELSPKLMSLRQSIVKLNRYKEEYLISRDRQTLLKVQKINVLIADTEQRISAFESGQLDAFFDYVEKNKEAIDLLNENRVTGALWKSILLVLATGIIPGLVGGVIQAIATKGNAFLFFNMQTQSGQLALNVQTDVTELLVR
ncbi:MAG: hypothetical protein P4L79_08575 [Legionella sp.]|uniref:hypothetical protein n=1 Tax=Legionella sp. TaxID=459 RepID=UPI002842B008|nr:hypothetical protein [Legionella sp.]